MSDTPIDRTLDTKRSIRFPEFLDQRVSDFLEQYNDQIRDAGLPDAAEETFILNSASDAHRRLLDIGLAYYETDGLPFGYTFDPENIVDFENTSVSCPSCGETDTAAFRVGAETGMGGGVNFQNVKCLSCDDTHRLSDVVTEKNEPFF